jgi:hypothetical protein
MFSLYVPSDAVNRTDPAQVDDELLVRGVPRDHMIDDTKHSDGHL